MFDNIRMVNKAVGLLQDIKRRDWPEFQNDLIQLMTLLGFAKDHPHALLMLQDLRNKDMRAAINEFLFEAVTLIDMFTKEDTPKLMEGPLRRGIFAELKVAEADPHAWYATNKEEVKEGMKRPIGRWLINRHPGIFNEEDNVFFDHLENGTLVSATLAGKIDVEKVIKFLDKILPFLALAAFVCPYIMPVYVCLKLISLCYHYRHPDGPKVGLAFDEL